MGVAKAGHMVARVAVMHPRIGTEAVGVASQEVGRIQEVRFVAGVEKNHMILSYVQQGIACAINVKGRDIGA